MIKTVYDWVPIEEDMPNDDPLDPNISLPVRIKLENGRTLIGFYCNTTGKWYKDDTKNEVKCKVIAWTSENERRQKKRYGKS